MTRPAPKEVATAGFTYIELVSVIAITSILALTAYPLINGKGPGLQATAGIVKADIQFTQSMAMSAGTARSIVFIKDSGRYSYALDGAGADGYHRDLTDLGAGVAMGGDMTVTFNSLGEPMDLTEDVEVSVVQGADSLGLVISAYTGRVALKVD